jgi:hypothetical protein
VAVIDSQKFFGLMYPRAAAMPNRCSILSHQPSPGQEAGKLAGAFVLSDPSRRATLLGPVRSDFRVATWHPLKA